MANTDTSTSAFEKACIGLWLSLQKHLEALHKAEKEFLQSVAFTNTFPFSASSVDAELLNEYWAHRNALRDLYTDETIQLDTLTKAIRNKSYSEEEKKQLYLLILGYTDMAASVFELMDTHIPANTSLDEELSITKSRFDRIRKFIRLNIKGVSSILIKF